MKKLLFILLNAYTIAAGAHSSNWRQADVNELKAVSSTFTLPSQYKSYALQTQTLKYQLQNLQANTIISFPMPDGSMRPFKITEAPMMAAGLANAYKDIRTFNGVAVDNPAVLAKFDITLLGFHAMIMDGTNTVFIDPYTNDAQYYIVYNKRDAARSATSAHCELANNADAEIISAHKLEPGNKELPPVQLKTSDAMRRTYRLALACTGEYSKAVAGSSTPSKALSLSAIVTTMNRVNGVFEKEIDVHLELIANDTDVIYIDPATDPFTGNNNGNTLKNENGTNTNTVIGEANYDIGHAFSTGAGGIAELGCVCLDFTKAEGVTGQPNPTGDAFAIDFVVHEMGHQFGATHTFNGNTGSCAGNAASISAYEPGSGSTIMAYAGICNVINDLQLHSDDYFHAVSLNQMFEFISDIGEGGACAAMSASGNTPPTVPSVAASYNIPYRTPFELEAPEATDADHDALTYCWEEWDRGDFNFSFANTRRFGPIFRSIAPTTSRWRVFPKLDTLRHNVTYYLGEKVPDTDRVLRFKLTVRDVLNGHGTFNISDDTLVLNVTSTSGPFKVLYPNDYSHHLVSGSAATITWDVANTIAAPVSCGTVDILLSIDDGITFPYVLSANTANDGSEEVMVPADLYAGGCRVKVKGHGNVFFDMSDSNFPVFPWAQSVAGIENDNAVIVHPVPAQSILNIDVKGNEVYNAAIINTVGQQVWNGTMSGKSSLNVQQWAAGIYTLQLINKTSNNKVVKRIVVQ